MAKMLRSATLSNMMLGARKLPMPLLDFRIIAEYPIEATLAGNALWPVLMSWDPS